ncbi:Mitotic spindle checkpoint protein BUBR1 [Abeliophyllum distichum]|uniref:Mitotic spindle checkpoint protein BUBR1 n=1 Tax=Abeliophyllum distichum TaxID=126358 RepID=A0ABD1T0F6_9LAMI
MKIDRTPGASLSIYKDSSRDPTLERNKENNAIPSKWTSNKIPQRPNTRIGRPAAGPSIEIFVDEECSGACKEDNEGDKSSVLQLRPGDGKDLKKETELLREHPLRNFPPSSLPR